MDLTSMNELIRKDLEVTGATADEMVKAVEEGGLSADLWTSTTGLTKPWLLRITFKRKKIEKTSFCELVGATKFNKWMKKAGLFFNKQTGRWTRHKDMR